MVFHASVSDAICTAMVQPQAAFLAKRQKKNGNATQHFACKIVVEYEIILNSGDGADDAFSFLKSLS